MNERTKHYNHLIMKCGPSTFYLLIIHTFYYSFNIKPYNSSIHDRADVLYWSTVVIIKTTLIRLFCIISRHLGTMKVI